MVDPQRIPGPCDSPGFVFAFHILLDRKPVFVLQLKSPSDLGCDSSRAAADKQILARISDLTGSSSPYSSICSVLITSDFIDECPLPFLHAVSAIGTQLRFYTKDLDSGLIASTLDYSSGQWTNTAPQAYWDCDILEPEA